MPANLLIACSEGHTRIVRRCIDISNHAWETLHTLPRNERRVYLAENVQSLIVDSQWHQAMINACRNGHIDIIEILPLSQSIGNDTALYEAYKNGHDIAHLVHGIHGSEAFNGACRGGHIAIVRHIIDIHDIPANVRPFGWVCDGCRFHTGHNNGIYICRGILEAINGGHIDIVILLLQHTTELFPSFLQSACRIGHHELIQLFIDRGINDWHAALLGACEGGYADVAQDMIRRGADNYETSLYYACRYGHVDVVELLKTYTTDWQNGFVGACEGGYIDIVRNILGNVQDHTAGFRMACRTRQHEIIRFLISRNVYPAMCVYEACNSGDVELTRHMLSVRRDLQDIDLAFKHECQAESAEMAEVLISAGAYALHDGLLEACHNGNYEVAKMLIARGVPCQKLIQTTMMREDIHLINLILQNSAVPRYAGYHFKDNNITRLIVGLME